MKRFGFENGRIVTLSIVVVAVIVAVVAAIRLGRQGPDVGLPDSDYPSDPSSLSSIDPELMRYREIGKPIRTGLFESRALAVGPSGRLYVAGDETIKVMDAGGRMMGSIPLAVSPRCLAVTEKELYVGTWDRVLVLGENGEVRAAWPGLGENARITGIAVDDEYVFVAEPRQFSGGAQTPTPGKQIILDVAVDESGRVYILDRLRNVVRIFTKKAAV